MTEWGSDPHLSAFESLMWRTEVNPRLRSTGVVLEVLDQPPDHDRFIAAHEWGTRILPRLRSRVIEDPLGLTAPRWAVDRDFDLTYHLRIVRLPEPGTMQQVLDQAQVMAMAPFDRARPLWEATLVEGLEEGRAAYLLKLHHSVADGQGIVQMLDILHSDRVEPGHSSFLPVPPDKDVSGTGLLVQGALGAPRRALHELLGTAGRISSVADRIVSSPREAVTGTARYAQSLGRMLGPPPAPRSPLLEQRSLGRRLGTLDVELSELRAAGKSVGGSLNDAFMAALAGGMRHYHEQHAMDVDEITAALPVSTRTADDAQGSNKFAGARIALPVAERDPRERMRIIGERVRAARDEPALNFMELMAPMMSRLPGSVSASMSARVTSTIDLNASNIRGLDRVAYFAGSRVERIYPIGAAPGPAVMVALLSYNGTCCIGVNVNAAAIPDHEVFLRCIEAGFDEVLAPGRARGNKSAAA